MRRFVFVLVFLFAINLFSTVSLRAQTADPSADLGESAKMIADLRKQSGKTLIFVFDVSGSMRSGGMLGRAREAAVNILRDGTAPGDRVVFFTFGAGYKKLFDTTLATEADKTALIDQVPSKVEDGEGTNIRRPHHEALKILEQIQPKPGTVVLLTDSYNDEPRTSDTTYADYVKYYTPGGRLAKYPDTPENRDYERLLNTLARSRKINSYGIGVQIDESGRPVERLPQEAPKAAPLVETPTNTEPMPPPKPDNTMWWVLGGFGLLAVLGIIAALILPSFKPLQVKITGIPGVPGNTKNVVLKGKPGLQIGGGGFATDVVNLPGVREPVATVIAAGGRMQLLPGDGKTVAAGNSAAASNQNSTLRVYHNGLPLEKAAPMNFGDELRVSTVDADGIPRDFRLRFEDPKKTF